MNAYIGVEPRTIKAGGVALVRGVRVTLDASGLATVTAIGTRGDYITAQDIPAGEYGMAFSLSGGGKVPAVASETTVAGDPAYSAASGQTSKTSAGAVVMGRWVTGATVGVLGEVELMPAL